MALYRRVVAINTGLLVVAALLLAFSPATVSREMPVEEWLVLALGTALVAIVNVVLLRRVFEPLRSLQATMRRIDPRTPGRRAGLEGFQVQEVTDVVHAFNEMLDRLETERATSRRRALAAQEAERRRVARELHDEVGQLLTGVVLQLEGMTHDAPSPLREGLREVQDTARAGMDTVREIARGLRPPALDEFGLRSALVSLAEEFRDRTGIVVRHELVARPPRLDAETELAIYRIAQEALTNVARHARATRVELRLTEVGDTVQLKIRDDGVGVPSRDALDAGGGVAGMRERALLVRGAVRIEPAPGRGTDVRLEVPS